MNDYSGFSLIELLITLTVLSIVLAIGVPSVIGWVRAMEVRSSAESLRSALQALEPKPLHETRAYELA